MSVLVYTPKLLQWQGLGCAKARSLGLHLGLSLGWQAPKYLNHALLPPKVHGIRKQSWDSNTSTLTCNASVSSRVFITVPLTLCYLSLEFYCLCLHNDNIVVSA